jgi:hypothetical protein
MVLNIRIVTLMLTLPPVTEPFQDSFDGSFGRECPLTVDNYFDDYDFEDRPDIEESPRIDEFDANT